MDYRSGYNTTGTGTNSQVSTTLYPRLTHVETWI